MEYHNGDVYEGMSNQETGSEERETDRATTSGSQERPTPDSGSETRCTDPAN